MFTGILMIVTTLTFFFVMEGECLFNRIMIAGLFCGISFIVGTLVTTLFNAMT